MFWWANIEEHKKFSDCAVKNITGKSVEWHQRQQEKLLLASSSPLDTMPA
jgi:hypothetical protein